MSDSQLNQWLAEGDDAAEAGFTPDPPASPPDPEGAHLFVNKEDPANPRLKWWDGVAFVEPVPANHGSTHESGGGDAIKIDDLAAPDDNTDLDASTSAHGLLLKATAPASGLLSAVGIGNGETAYSMKPLFDTANPAALGTAGPGTQVIAARRDHVHAMPAIDALAAASDNTTLNASTSAHGLLRKLDNSASHFLDGQGNWSTVTGGSGGSFGPRSVSVLTTGSSATYTVPAGIYRLKVRLVGAGGGGGGSDGTNGGISCGGSAGGYCEKVYQTTPGATFLYTVSNTGGAGGTAGNNSGSTGADTIFDVGGSPVTGAGGVGGGSMATGSTFVVAGPGAGGAATGGDVNIPGGVATGGVRNSGTSYALSKAADSPLGHGGFHNVSGTGGAATGYGAGGGGTTSPSTVADQTGGAGGPGVIIVEEYN